MASHTERATGGAASGCRGDRLYVGLKDGQVLAINRDSGEEIWTSRRAKMPRACWRSRPGDRRHHRESRLQLATRERTGLHGGNGVSVRT